jgi:hypothetical protein
MTRRWAPQLIFLLCVLLFRVSTAQAEITLQQDDGSVLTLPSHASRIVSLAPNLTELAFAAGAGKQIVATVEYSDYPQDARQIPRIGDAFRFDLEKIVALKPDLVLAWASGNPELALQKLKHATRQTSPICWKPLAGQPAGLKPPESPRTIFVSVYSNSNQATPEPGQSAIFTRLPHARCSPSMAST